MDLRDNRLAVPAAPADTFTGYGYSTSCSGSCMTVTDGILASTGQGITWPGQVSLGKPVPVRDPVWDVLFSRFDESVPDALVGVGLGLFFAHRHLRTGR